MVSFTLEAMKQTLIAGTCLLIIFGTLWARTCFRASNKEINTFMEQLNIKGDYSGLESYFVHRVLDIVNDLNRSVIIWEDLIGNGVNVSEDTIVQVWKPGYNEMLNEV